MNLWNYSIYDEHMESIQNIRPASIAKVEKNYHREYTSVRQIFEEQLGMQKGFKSKFIYVPMNQPPMNQQPKLSLEVAGRICDQKGTAADLKEHWPDL